jgi:hypothetical protein
MKFVLFVLVLVLVFFAVTVTRKLEPDLDPYHIVVARYKEDPWSWLPKNDPYVKVYNKGEPLKEDSSSKCEHASLPNIGRESHTYLTYIVQNYDALPEIVFFTQGSPDHTGGLSVEQFTSIPGNCSENFHTTKGPYYTFDPDGHLRDQVHYGVDLHPCELNFYDWFTRYICEDVDPRGDITWYMGATFSVKSEKIRTRSKEYYEDLLTQFPKDQSNPEVGHYFERSWYYMFNCHL